MADISHVEEALVTATANILFPNTSYTPYTVASSVLGIPCRVYRGWPVDTQLNTDLAAGVTNVSIFSMPGVAKNETKFLRQTTVVNVSQAPTTMTATKSGSTVTFAGTSSISQVIGVGVRREGGGYGFSYRMAANDTPSSVAAMFAANLTGASASGAVLTVAAPSGQIVVATGGDVTTLTEVHRSKQMFAVTIWSPTVAIRDSICNLIDPGLIYINHLYFPDGSVSEPVIGAGTHVDDVVQRENMWKRSLYYTITYPTEYATVTPVMVLGKDVLSPTVTLID